MNKENRHHDLIRVRSQLEGTLRGELHDATWVRLKDAAQEYLEQEHLDDPDFSWEDLRTLAEEALDNQRQHEREVLERYGLTGEPKAVSSRIDLRSAKPESFQRIFPTKLPEREKRRADVQLKIGMRQAAERPEVKRFREERLRGQRVLYDEAEAFISPTWPEEIRDWELAELAQRLERDYGWRQDDAAWFVLNGAAPRLLPLKTHVSMHRVSRHEPAHSPSYCEISLQVAPWIPSEVVEKAFVQARDWVRGGSGPGTVSLRRLEVLRFVEEHRTEDGQRPNFEALLEKWNQEHTRWTYANYRALSKAYREAYQEVFHPRYQMPNVESTGPDADAP
jgi:hypothetical protein